MLKKFTSIFFSTCFIWGAVFGNLEDEQLREEVIRHTDYWSIRRAIPQAGLISPTLEETLPDIVNETVNIGYPPTQDAHFDQLITLALIEGPSHVLQSLGKIKKFPFDLWRHERLDYDSFLIFVYQVGHLPETALPRFFEHIQHGNFSICSNFPFYLSIFEDLQQAQLFLKFSLSKEFSWLCHREDLCHSLVQLTKLTPTLLDLAFHFQHYTGLLSDLTSTQLEAVLHSFTGQEGRPPLRAIPGSQVLFVAPIPSERLALLLNPALGRGHASTHRVNGLWKYSPLSLSSEDSSYASLDTCPWVYRLFYLAHHWNSLPIETWALEIEEASSVDLALEVLTEAGQQKDPGDLAILMMELLKDQSRKLTSEALVRYRGPTPPNDCIVLDSLNCFPAQQGETQGIFVRIPHTLLEILPGVRVRSETEEAVVQTVQQNGDWRYLAFSSLSPTLFHSPALTCHTRTTPVWWVPKKSQGRASLFLVDGIGHSNLDAGDSLLLEDGTTRQILTINDDHILFNGPKIFQPIEAVRIISGSSPLLHSTSPHDHTVSSHATTRAFTFQKRAGEYLSLEPGYRVLNETSGEDHLVTGVEEEATFIKVWLDLRNPYPKALNLSELRILPPLEIIPSINPDVYIHEIEGRLLMSNWQAERNILLPGRSLIFLDGTVDSVLATYPTSLNTYDIYFDKSIQTPARSALHQHLKTLFPVRCVPNSYFFIENFPLTEGPFKGYHFFVPRPDEPLFELKAESLIYFAESSFPLKIQTVSFIEERKKRGYAVKLVYIDNLLKDIPESLSRSSHRFIIYPPNSIIDETEGFEDRYRTISAIPAPPSKKPPVSWVFQVPSSAEESPDIHHRRLDLYARTYQQILRAGLHLEDCQQDFVQAYFMEQALESNIWGRTLGSIHRRRLGLVPWRLLPVRFRNAFKEEATQETLHIIHQYLQTGCLPAAEEIAAVGDEETSNLASRSPESDPQHE